MAKGTPPSLAIADGEALQHAAGTLIANIRFSSVDAPIRSIVFTGSVPNEGKTTVALATAIAMGKSGRQCLVVEGDMRRNSLRGVLGVRPQHGLHALLTERCTAQEAICATKLKNVWFLDAENGLPNPDTILASGQFRKLLKSLEGQFRYVVIDTPPVAAFPDAALAASVADATVLVVREGHTNKRDILYSLELLKNADANILGTVINGLRQGGGGYGYGYGYGYYSKYYDEPGDGSLAGADAPGSLSHSRLQTPEVAHAPAASRDQAAVPASSVQSGGSQSGPPSPGSLSANPVSEQIPRIVPKAPETRPDTGRHGL